MRIMRRILPLFCAFFLLSSVVGVYAIWQYWSAATPADGEGLTGVSGFYYTSDEVLPDDGAHDMNALYLVQYIIYDVKAGLNSKKGDAIFAQLKDSDDKLLHSKDKITNSNFDHIFSTTESTALEFTLQYVSDTEIYIYIYADDDLRQAESMLEAAERAGEELTVRITTYVTSVVRSAVGKLDWDDKGSAKGMAKVVDDGSFFVVDPATFMSGETLEA